MQPPVKLRNSKLCLVSIYLTIHGIFKRLAKSLIRLRVCAGWSEPLLVAHATLLEISCRGSIQVFFDLSLRNSFLASGDFRHLLITLANSLDPDQRTDLFWTVWHSDRVPEIFLEKVNFEKKSANDNKSRKNYQACKELITTFF